MGLEIEPILTGQYGEGGGGGGEEGRRRHVIVREP